MLAPLRRFRIPARMPTKAVVGQLAAGLSLAAEAPVSGHRVIFDTADWRLYTAGWTLLTEEAAGSGRRLTTTLCDRNTDAVLATVEAAGRPDYASDLPDDIRQRVAGVVEGRRLLPQVEAEARYQRLSVLNADEKTTTRVLIEHYLVSPPAGPRRILRAVAVLPVRGYDRSADRVCADLTAAGLRPYEQPLLPLLLRLLRRPQPGDNLGPGVPLNRSMAASQAMSAILGRLHGHVTSNELGVRNQLDTEFLHDYRVAIRRARSMLRRAPGALPPGQAGELEPELEWLAGLTSPVRDLDVHLEELAERDAEEVEPLRKHLRCRHEQAHAELVAGMDSPRYTRLLTLWAGMASPADISSSGESASAPLASQPAGEFADHHIWRAYRRVMSRGRRIDDSSPPEALHDLRKRAKELRYLLECFQTLYPGDDRGAVVRELKALQDNLGEFQDSAVQAATLRSTAEELMIAGTATVPALMTMGRLADEYERREGSARREFAGRFDRFSSAANQKRFRALVASTG